MDILIYLYREVFLTELIIIEKHIIQNKGKSIIFTDSMLNEIVWVESKNIQVKNKNLLKKIKKIKSPYKFLQLFFNKIRLVLMKIKKTSPNFFK